VLCLAAVLFRDWICIHLSLAFSPTSHSCRRSTAMRSITFALLAVCALFGASALAR
jgi:hypothetical protein